MSWARIVTCISLLVLGTATAAVAGEVPAPVSEDFPPPLTKLDFGQPQGPVSQIDLLLSDPERLDARLDQVAEHVEPNIAGLHWRGWGWGRLGHFHHFRYRPFLSFNYYRPSVLSYWRPSTSFYYSSYYRAPVYRSYVSRPVVRSYVSTPYYYRRPYVSSVVSAFASRPYVYSASYYSTPYSSAYCAPSFTYYRPSYVNYCSYTWPSYGYSSAWNTYYSGYCGSPGYVSYDFAPSYQVVDVSPAVEHTGCYYW